MGKKDSPDPTPLKASLDRVARRLGGPDSSALTGVFARWAEVVGDQVAAHCRPLSLSRGVLVVAVSDPAWATQLTYLEGDLVARFRDALGEGVVQRVEVRQRRV